MQHVIMKLQHILAQHNIILGKHAIYNRSHPSFLIPLYHIISFLPLEETFPLSLKCLNDPKRIGNPIPLQPQGDICTSHRMFLQHCSEKSGPIPLNSLQTHNRNAFALNCRLSQPLIITRSEIDLCTFRESGG